MQEGQDRQEEIDGVSFIYEERIAPHVEDKVIDYVTGVQSGFQIKSEGPDFCCGTCSC
ncbi:MAG: hypothetical protein GX989_04390 [Firmicutes bacterium]|jgi:Fe-S cluster assembly iron-binding protein IscA|nr:hypothetical protein [Bacillota bacterium]